MLFNYSLLRTGPFLPELCRQRDSSFPHASEDQGLLVLNAWNMALRTVKRSVASEIRGNLQLQMD